MIVRVTGVSGVYSSFPMNSGLIPRHTIRERGFDSRLRIKFSQNGAISKSQTGFVTLQSLIRFQCQNIFFSSYP